MGKIIKEIQKWSNNIKNVKDVFVWCCRIIYWITSCLIVPEEVIVWEYSSGLWRWVLTKAWSLSHSSPASCLPRTHRVFLVPGLPVLLVWAAMNLAPVLVVILAPVYANTPNWVTSVPGLKSSKSKVPVVAVWTSSALPRCSELPVRKP